jgi:hypothetical protein
VGTQTTFFLIACTENYLFKITRKRDSEYYGLTAHLGNLPGAI